MYRQLPNPGQSSTIAGQWSGQHVLLTTVYGQCWPAPSFLKRNEQQRCSIQSEIIKKQAVKFLTINGSKNQDPNSLDLEGLDKSSLNNLTAQSSNRRRDHQITKYRRQFAACLQAFADKRWLPYNKDGGSIDNNFVDLSKCRPASTGSTSVLRRGQRSQNNKTPPINKQAKDESEKSDIDSFEEDSDVNQSKNYQPISSNQFSGRASSRQSDRNFDNLTPILIKEMTLKQIKEPKLHKRRGTSRSRLLIGGHLERLNPPPSTPTSQNNEPICEDGDTEPLYETSREQQTPRHGLLTPMRRTPRRTDDDRQSAKLEVASPSYRIGSVRDILNSVSCEDLEADREDDDAELRISNSFYSERLQDESADDSDDENIPEPRVPDIEELNKVITTPRMMLRPERYDDLIIEPEPGNNKYDFHSTLEPSSVRDITHSYLDPMKFGQTEFNPVRCEAYDLNWRTTIKASTLVGTESTFLDKVQRLARLQRMTRQDEINCRAKMKSARPITGGRRRTAKELIVDQLESSKPPSSNKTQNSLLSINTSNSSSIPETPVISSLSLVVKPCIPECLQSACVGDCPGRAHSITSGYSVTCSPDAYDMYQRGPTQIQNRNGRVQSNLITSRRGRRTPDLKTARPQYSSAATCQPKRPVTSCGRSISTANSGKTPASGKMTRCFSGKKRRPKTAK